MKKIKFADLRKTVYYLKRNGLKKTLGAVRERMDAAEQESYRWEPMSMAEREAQSRQAREEGFSVTFSIVTPTYRTPEKYLRELIESLRNQSYDRWELVLADALPDWCLRQAESMAGRLRALGLNIDYFPTNFIPHGGILWYVDYECNSYMEQWDFPHWGRLYWSKTPELLAYAERERGV